MFNKRCLIAPGKEEVLESLRLEISKVVPNGTSYAYPSGSTPWGVVWESPKPYSLKIVRDIWCDEKTSLKNHKVYYYEGEYESRDLCCASRKLKPVCNKSTTEILLTSEEISALVSSLGEVNRFRAFESVQEAEEYISNTKEKMVDLIHTPLIEKIEENYPSCTK
jgi:hypothetical protein